MEQLLRQRAESIWTAAIRSVLPDEAVRRALEHFHPQGRVFLVAAGKAAWQMAHAALAVLGCVDGWIVITKYGHVRGPLPGVTCCEAGHPVPDDNSFAATQRALALVSGLRAGDTVLFLLSGGGSALFEKPLLPAEELQAITQALLACGADIVEINTIRKRLSAVKGGRFALACAPAAVYSVVLSDILGDPLDMIASGPACPDSSTCAQAAAITEKYRLALSPAAAALPCVGAGDAPQKAAGLPGLTAKAVCQQNRLVPFGAAGVRSGTAQLPHAAGDFGGHIVQRFGCFLLQKRRSRRGKL